MRLLEERGLANVALELLLPRVLLHVSGHVFGCYRLTTDVTVCSLLGLDFTLAIAAEDEFVFLFPVGSLRCLNDVGICHPSPRAQLSPRLSKALDVIL